MGLHCTEAFVTIAFVDLEIIVDFYSQLLQQKPVSYLANVYAEFKLPGLRLGIFRPKGQEEFVNSVAGAMSLCLEVEDLVTAIAYLTTLGYPPPGKIITANHGQEIYAYDPGGNRLILHQSA